MADDKERQKLDWRQVFFGMVSVVLAGTIAGAFALGGIWMQAGKDRSAADDRAHDALVEDREVAKLQRGERLWEFEYEQKRDAYQGFYRSFNRCAGTADPGVEKLAASIVRSVVNEGYIFKRRLPDSVFLRMSTQLHQCSIAAATSAGPIDLVGPPEVRRAVYATLRSLESVSRELVAITKTESLTDYARLMNRFFMKNFFPSSEVPGWQKFVRAARKALKSE
ncbi:hypothetical protein [Nocardioides sp. HB32]